MGADDFFRRTRHTRFFEAKVAVPPPERKAKPFGSAGKKLSSRFALRYFFLPSLDAVPAGERL